MKLTRRLATIAVLAVATATLGPVTPGRAGPDAPAHGVTSAWVEHVRFVPTEPILGTGARLVGHYFYLTSSKNLSIYDVSNPEDPQLVSYTPLGLPEWENEDVATNGKILIISQTGNVPLVGGGSNTLHVWDVTDKAKPVEIGSLSGAANHTMTCLADCTFLYGSSGNIIDLRDPTKPILAGNWGQKAGVSAGHDVREDAPGIVVVSSGSGSNCPGAILGTTDPLNPVKLACMGAGQKTGEYMHSETWPNQATDRFMIVGSETNLQPRCGAANGATYVYDTTDWRSGTYRKVDRMQAKNGFLFDGNPAVNVLGCSAHWVEAAPTFHNGGIFVQGYYEHGARFFYVNGAGKLTPVGFFTPFGGSTSATHWITDRIVYVVDYQRGFDVLKYNGPLPSNPAPANAVTALSATRSGDAVAVTGSAAFAGETAPVVAATDPSGDGPLVPQASGAAGVDLTEASVSQPEAQLPYLQFRWKVSDLPAPETAPGQAPEAIVYTWSFLANGKQYQVQAKLNNLGSTGTADDPSGAVIHMGRAFRLRGNCATLVAVSNCSHLAWLDGSFDVTNNIVSVRVPIGASYAPDIAPGAVISTTKTGTSTSPSIYAAYSAGVTSFGVSGTGSMADEAEWTSYTIPKPSVTLGFAPAGTDPATVNYATPATLSPDGTFTGNLSAVPIGYDVFAKACFGTSCAVGSVSA